jgi:hypothetical protein
MLAAGYLRWYITLLHSVRVTLRDPSAASVALATDLEAYRVLLAASPSPTWRRYYDHFITEKGLGPVFNEDVQSFHHLLTMGRIIELPNGSRAEQLDQISLSELDNPQQRYAVQAIKVRIRAGPYKGLEAWTSPELVGHEGHPLP